MIPPNILEMATYFISGVISAINLYTGNHCPRNRRRSKK